MQTDTERDYEISEKIKNMCFAAREAWLQLANLSDGTRNTILEKTAARVAAEKAVILAANARDIETGRADGLSDALIDRLTLNENRFQGLLRSLHEIKALPDPLGLTLETRERPNGLKITKISVPIGVIGLVYESRPNVTIEAGALAIKSGNAMILKGGKEAYHSNQALAKCFVHVFEAMGLQSGIVSLIPFKERTALQVLLQQKATVDLIIPRGGEGLINFVAAHSLIPVLKHYKGLCHTYIDREADYQKAIKIAINAKATQETLVNVIKL